MVEGHAGGPPLVRRRPGCRLAARQRAKCREGPRKSASAQEEGLTRLLAGSGGKRRAGCRSYKRLPSSTAIGRVLGSCGAKKLA
jgi:hypothetical protein